MSSCCDQNGLCMISPSPELRMRMKDDLSRLSGTLSVTGPGLGFRQPRRPGLNDGLTIPGSYFPLGTSLEAAVRSAAAQRAPLRGPVRIVVVLADFADRQMSPGHDRQYFENLFFSRRVLPKGSVREYYDEVTHGLVDIVGEVVGPYRMPLTLAQYANGQSGMSDFAPNARTLARDAAEAANRNVDFAPYDNDGNGFVDAFIVIHAGGGAEVTGSAGDIWSHKWVLANGEYNADGTKIFAYLTVPEDARIGVCCHELGHLLFGWPDLYDTDYSSEGLGNWCLMAGGSWNGNGDRPAHPSAWCKAQQGWVSVVNQTGNGTVTVEEVITSHTVHRFWKDGAQGKEYFLVENRQRRQYDDMLPGDGLLVYHVDDAVDSNADERHPRVALLQADGKTDLERGINRGDGGDPYPGAMGNTALTANSTPNSRSYGSLSTDVTLTQISPSGPVMTAHATVRSPSPSRPLHAHGTASDGTGNERVHRLLEVLARILLAGEDGTEGKSPAPYDGGWPESVDRRLAVLEAATVLSRTVDAQLPAPVFTRGAENGLGATSTPY